MSRVERLANLEMPVRNRSRTAIIFIVVAVLLIGVFVVWWFRVWLSTVPPNRESPSTTIRNVGLVIGGIIAMVLALWRGYVADRQSKATQTLAETSHRQVETSERGLLNERYQKGAEMLGSEFLIVRLGGIYALQRLAKEHAEQYHVQIMRLFCAFVRHPTEDKDDTAKSTDPNGILNKIGLFRVLSGRRSQIEFPTVEVEGVDEVLLIAETARRGLDPLNP